MYEHYSPMDDPFCDPFAVEDTQHRYHARARETPVVRYDAGKGVALLGMHDTLEINKRRDILGNGAPGPSYGGQRPVVPLDLDGPEHRRFRRLLDPLFTRKALDRFTLIIRDIANELIDGFIADGEVDIVTQFCTPLPAKVFLELLGIPQSDLPSFQTFKDTVMRPGGATVEENITIAKTAGVRMYAYFSDVLDARQAEMKAGTHTDGIIGDLITASVEDDRLTRDEILDVLYILMIAGLDTVAASLGIFTLWLARNPEHRQQIIEDPAKIPAAVEELLRFHSPAHSVHRWATEDTEIGGCPVAKGEHIHVILAAANLDDELFPDPLTVSFDRPTNRHVAFGSGFHRCLGSHLGRIQLNVAMQELHRRIPEYTVKPGAELPWINQHVRTVESVPLVFQPSPAHEGATP